MMLFRIALGSIKTVHRSNENVLRKMETKRTLILRIRKRQNEGLDNLTLQDLWNTECDTGKQRISYITLCKWMTEEESWGIAKSKQSFLRSTKDRNLWWVMTAHVLKGRVQGCSHIQKYQLFNISLGTQ